MLFQIEPHAVERYIQRHAPNLQYPEAYELLYDHANNRGPIKLKKRTHAGDDLWRLTALDILLVAKFENGVNVAVTCIPHREKKHLTREEHGRLTEYQDRIAERERKAKEDNAARSRLFNELKQIAETKKDRRSVENAELAATLEFKRKMHLFAEERNVLRDQFEIIERSFAHESRLQKRCGEQATLIIQMKKALKIAVRFVLGRRKGNIDVESPVVEELRQVYPWCVQPEFYNSKD